MKKKKTIFFHLGFSLLRFWNNLWHCKPLDSKFTWCGIEGKKKSQPPGSILLNTLSPSYEWEEPKPSFSELYLSLWLLQKTSVVQMWDGKSGLHWHQLCGCFGAGVHTAVGYRCLLSSINVANMWNQDTHNTTQRSTPLIVWEITPSWRNYFLKVWNAF